MPLECFSDCFYRTVYHFAFGKFVLGEMVGIRRLGACLVGFGVFCTSDPAKFYLWIRCIATFWSHLVLHFTC